MKQPRSRADGTHPSNALLQAAVIPRKTLFGNPDFTMLKISPDGRSIAYIAPTNGVPNVWVAPLERVLETSDVAAGARPVTRVGARGVSHYQWARASDGILFLQDRDGDENWHLLRADLRLGDAVDLTPFDGVQAQIIQESERKPHHLLIGLNRDDPRWHDAYLLDVRDGSLKLIAKNGGFTYFFADGDLNPRFGRKYNSDGSASFCKYTGEERFERYLDVGIDDALTTDMIGFDATGERLYLRDSRGRDTSALVERDLRTESQIVLAESLQADVTDVLFDPLTRIPLAAAFAHTKKRWIAIDPEAGQELDRIQELYAPCELTVSSQSSDGNLWILTLTRDTALPQYVLYERSTGATRLLGEDRSALAKPPLSRMHPRILRARDGLELVSYLSLPPGIPKEGPTAPLPTVLFVHGGPWSRDSWGFNPYHQLLANRGYAVLSVNYRASLGFGKSHLNAGNREWAKAMHTDLLDAVEWAKTEGIADPDRIAIMGFSYGGYAALAGLAFSPDVFRCGIDVFGISNLISFLRSFPPQWECYVSGWKHRLGDWDKEADFRMLEEASPLHSVDRIRSPLLIAHGANDTRVRQAESDQIVDALRSRGLPVTYALYPDEGHGFVRAENRISLIALCEEFLSAHLGGRAEAAQDDLRASSAILD